MPLTSSVWFTHSSSSLITGSSWRGGSVAVTNRAWIRVDGLLTGAPRHGGEHRRRSRSEWKTGS